MAKKNAKSNVSHEGLLVDVVIGRSSTTGSGDTCTTTSPLTEDASQKMLQQKPAVVRWRKSSKQACEKYELNGGKKLSKTTPYRAIRRGRLGESPMTRGPSPKIPDILLDVCSSHTEVSQVGEGGELSGRDIKRLINASVLGTPRYKKSFAIESAWKKLRTRNPESLQAGTKVSMDEARSKWTTVNNLLEQWFDDAKSRLDQNWACH